MFARHKLSACPCNDAISRYILKSRTVRTERMKSKTTEGLRSRSLVQAAKRSRNISRDRMCAFRTLTCLHRTDSPARRDTLRAISTVCLHAGFIRRPASLACFLRKSIIIIIRSHRRAFERFSHKHLQSFKIIRLLSDNVDVSRRLSRTFDDKTERDGSKTTGEDRLNRRQEAADVCRGVIVFARTSAG